MKVISFPHYTCGGLLCDILNHTFSPVADNGGISSIGHSGGKIGDSNTVLVDFSEELLMEKLCTNNDGQWLGTHCWLGNVDCTKFEKVINITVTSYRSKIYRWLRFCNLWLSKTSEYRHLSNMELVDKQRETAKNYVVPFMPVHHDNVVNLEFADVVDNRQSFRSLAGADCQKHLDRWRTINSFLYDKDVWNSDLCLRFYEAEVELASGKFYVYE